MKRTIAMSKPLLMGFDENAYATALAYHDRDLAEELDVIRINRAQMMRVLRGLPPEAFERQAVHNEAGLVTLRQFVQSMVNHIEHHCRFVDEKRKALGVK
jgi:hypothetical protein